MRHRRPIPSRSRDSLTYVAASGAPFSGAGDQYVGLDRFGRIETQRWETRDATPVALDVTRYDYDRNGNRIKADVLTAGAPTSGPDQVDQVWAYDALDRLIENRRGTLSVPAGGGPWTMPSVHWLAGWGLDTLGITAAYLTVTEPTFGDANLEGNVAFADMVSVAQHYNTPNGSWGSGDFNGDGSVDFADLTIYAQNNGYTGGNVQTTELRTYDGQNRLLTMAGGASALAYDAAGNQTTDQDGNVTTYDAWDRPTRVESGATTLTAYAYDGLGRRVTEGPAAATVHHFYNAGWQLLETRLSAGGTANESFVWSAVFIDALVARDRDADGNPANGPEERVYSQWDANFNVLSLVGDADVATGGFQPGVIERYRYESYGAQTVLNADFTPDTLAGSDGTTADDSLAGFLKSDVLFRGGHQGGMGDRAVEGQMRFRERTLEVDQMRWKTEDPAGYIDAFNLYSNRHANPVNTLDPTGLSGFTDKFNGYGQAALALIGMADDEVQAAFDQTASDRINGMGDAAGISGLAGHNHTFDPSERRKGECWANCMKDQALDGLLDGFNPAGIIVEHGGLATGDGLALEEFPNAAAVARAVSEGAEGILRTGQSVSFVGSLVAEGMQINAIRKGNLLQGAMASIARQDLSQTAQKLGRAANVLAIAQFTADALECSRSCDSNPCAY